MFNALKLQLALSSEKQKSKQIYSSQEGLASYTTGLTIYNTTCWHSNKYKVKTHGAIEVQGAYCWTK